MALKISAETFPSHNFFHINVGKRRKLFSGAEFMKGSLTRNKMNSNRKINNQVPLKIIFNKRSSELLSNDFDVSTLKSPKSYVDKDNRILFNKFLISLRNKISKIKHYNKKRNVKNYNLFSDRIDCINSINEKVGNYINSTDNNTILNNSNFSCHNDEKNNSYNNINQNKLNFKASNIQGTSLSIKFHSRYNSKSINNRTKIDIKLPLSND